MEWTYKYRNSLPYNHFAVCDSEGYCHLPIFNMEGELDLPHLRNALARLTNLQLPSDSLKQEIRAKLQSLLARAKAGELITVKQWAPVKMRNTNEYTTKREAKRRELRRNPNPSKLNAVSEFMRKINKAKKAELVEIATKCCEELHQKDSRHIEDVELSISKRATTQAFVMLRNSGDWRVLNELEPEEVFIASIKYINVPELRTIIYTCLAIENGLPYVKRAA